MKDVSPLHDQENVMKLFFFTSIVTLFMIGCSQGLECSYSPKASTNNPNPQSTLHKDCGKFEGEDLFRISADHLNKLDYSYENVAQIVVRDKVFYVNRSGDSIRTIFFDNGGDYFSDGLARTISKGKMGYFNANLDVVITPQFDFAFPFMNGIAVVCNKCSVDKSDGQKTVAGGEWGVIDASGDILLPITSSKDALLSGQEFRRLISR